MTGKIKNLPEQTQSTLRQQESLRGPIYQNRTDELRSNMRFKEPNENSSVGPPLIFESTPKKTVKIRRLRRYFVKPRGLSFLAAAAVFVISIFAANVPYAPKTSAILSQGDGKLIYGEGAVTTPRLRDWVNSTNTLGSEDSGATAAATIRHTAIKGATTRNEMIAGVQTTGGALYIQRWNGSSWSAEWNVTVGDGPLSRFDITYERTSGDALVVYSGNVATTNELRYQTWNGSSWSGENNLDPVRTSGTVDAIQLEPREGTNEIGLAWGDTNEDLSADFWDGSSWTGEHSAALATSLSCIGTGALTSWSFDLAFESSSGELVVGWGIDATSDPRFMKRTAGAGGAWSGTTVVGTSAVEEVTDFEMVSDPNSDFIGWSNITGESTATAASPDLETGMWDGSSDTVSTRFNGDTATGVIASGTKNVTGGWVSSGGEDRYITVLDDASVGAVNWQTYNKNTNTWSTQTDYTAAPVPTAQHVVERITMNPFDESKLIYIVVDANSDLFVKQLSFDGTNLTWSSVEPSSTSPETSVSSVTGMSADFAYNKYVPPLTYTQSNYRWYNNNDAIQPTSAMAAEATACTMSRSSNLARLRINALVGGQNLDANYQGFKLQYSTTTAGSWADVSELNSWWNTSWLARKKVTFNNVDSADNLTDFPVLVSLNASNIDYTKTKDAGEDLRFIDADGSTVLKHEIEKWNESGTSTVWVKIPQIDSGSSTDHIFMYYNNTAATDGQDAANVWTNSYSAVWHMNQNPGGSAPQILDSTSANNDGTSQGTMTSGDLVAGNTGDAIDFDGVNDYISTANSSANPQNLTIEAWFKTPLASGKPIVQFNFNQTGTTLNSMDRNIYMGTDGRVRAHSYDGTNDVTASNGSFNNNVWNNATGTINDTANLLSIFMNGSFHSSIANANAENYTGYWRIGSYNNPLTAGSDGYFTGVIDEVRINSTVRSNSWIAAQYKTMSNAYNFFSDEESQTPVIKFKDNATPAHAAAVTSVLLSNSNVAGTYQEGNPTKLAAATTIGQRIEWDFALDFSLATEATTYYFRLVKSDGTAIDTYSVYPQITTPPGPGNIMRHGAWFVDGVEQPLYLD